MLETTKPEIKLKSTLLSAQQKEAYARDGFLVVPNFVQASVCDVLVERARKLLEEYDPEEFKSIFSTVDPHHTHNLYFLESGDKIRFFFEEKAIDELGELKSDKIFCINKIGHALHELDPVFYMFSHSYKLAVLAHDLGVIKPLLLQSMYIFKQPFLGGEVICHQDSTFLYTKGQPVTGLWFALEDATIENGCLWAIPGGHHISLKSRMIRDNNDRIATENYDHSSWPLEKLRPLEVQRGSLIVLHGLLPHMSKENLSARSRHAYSLHIMSANAEYAADNWLQRPHNMPFKGFLG